MNSPHRLVRSLTRACIAGALALSAFALFASVGAPPAKALCDIDTNPDCFPIPQYYKLSVSKTGLGSGTVSGGGISCGATCTRNYREGAAVVLTATPGSGSTFTGWSGCSSSSTTCTVRIYDDTSVRANFRGARLTIANSPPGAGSVARSVTGSSCGTSCYEYAPGTQVGLTPQPVWPYLFDHWSGACAGSGSCTVSMSSDRSVVANYVLRTFTLTVDVTGGTLGAVSGPGSNCSSVCTYQVTAGTTVALGTAAVDHASFAGWGGACSSSGLAATCTRTINGDTYASARFVTDPWLTSTTSGNGTITGPAFSYRGVCGHEYAFGTPITLTAAADPGLRLLGWSGCDSVSSNTCTVTLTSDRSVTATFVPQVLTLTLTVVGGFGSVDVTAPGEVPLSCALTCTRQYPAGTVITLSATAASGHLFGGWSGDCTGIGSCSLPMDADKSVTALFT